MTIFPVLRLFRHGLLQFFTDSKITDLYPFHVAKKILPKRSKGFLSVDLYRCNLCGQCLDFCPSNAISLNKDRYAITIDYTRCMFCGSCTNVCSKYALVFIDNFEAGSNNKEVYEYTFYLKKGV